MGNRQQLRCSLLPYLAPASKPKVRRQQLHPAVVPEIVPGYPKPMVDHAFARLFALDTYAIALKGQTTETE